MSIFESNGRQFLLKAEKLWYRDKQILEVLAQDKEQLFYPCEVVTADGERCTVSQPLSDEDVRALLDKDDSRPLVERIDWTETETFFAEEEGTTVTVTRVSPTAHVPLTCHLVDGPMNVAAYNLMVTVDEYVRLVRFVTDDPTYDVRLLQRTAPELYAKLTDSHRLPRPIQASTLVLLTSVEDTASRLPGEPEEECDAVYEYDQEDHVSQICMDVTQNRVFLWTDTMWNGYYRVGGDDMEQSNDLIIEEDFQLFCLRVGAILPASLMRAVGKLYEGFDADLRHIADFCDRNKIGYCWTRE